MAAAPVYRRWQAPSYGGPEQLACVEWAPPAALGARDVLVRVQASTATYTDHMILRGTYDPKFPTPVTPGYDCIGKVLAVGSGVKSLAAGDVIAAMPQHGCMAEAMVLQEAGCVKLSAAPPPEQAVCVVLTGATAYQMLHRAAGDRLKAPGASILVHGAAGGTGAMLVKLALLAGVAPDRIFGTCGARNLDAVRAMGVVAIDYKDAVPWEKRVLEATGGKGVSVVYDAIVTPDNYFSRGFACLAKGGKYVAYGVTNSDEPGKQDFGPIVRAFLKMVWRNSVWSCVDGKQAEFFHVAQRRAKHPADFDADVRALMELVSSGQLVPLVGRTWAFEELPQALESIAKREHTGKQVVVMKD